MYEIRGPNATGDAFNRAPCDPAAEAGYQCGGLATMIRNPVYYKHPSADNFSSLRYQFFGSSLSIADMNGDGIEDLVVGAHRHYVPNMHQSDFISKTLGSSYNNGVNAGQELTNSYYGINAESSGTQDPQYRGSVFIYYGTKFGVVAPKARSMIMDNGLGLYGTAPLISNDKHITFALSPPRWNAGMGLTPPLDGNGPQRMFGISMAAGDYNGDGLADLAVSSYNGQVYVYYGPICQTDNVPMLWGLATYANHNVAGDFSTVTESQRGRCTTPNFNTAGSQVTIPVAQATKLLNPQMISLSGASPSLRYGVVLMSAMPGKSGNLNGDPGVVPGDSISGTSDLIIGTHLDSDSNVPVASNKSTGKAIVLFGHCSSTPGCMMNSKPGLFVGPASYNGSLVSSTSGTQTFFQYSPVTLRPYEPDGSVPGFFQHYPTLGDLNGDKTGDLVMPTSQLNLGADRTTPVINGGGFKIIQ
jgi:hypothetical protein